MYHAAPTNEAAPRSLSVPGGGLLCTADDAAAIPRGSYFRSTAFTEPL